MSKRKNNHLLEVARKRAKSSPAEPTEDEERICSDQGSSALWASGEVGIIEKIFLKNFMCHSLLGPFTFGSNVNFIVGSNGSGKSAILTALIVGLGGKAQTTNRGSSLKGFVKEGESSAEISITLRNRGQDAYKPDVFGQSITIDLRISSEGLRTYKLKSKTGLLVSSKKEELVAILDHFNIQVDNPVSVLTQEMSKHFLHSKGEGDKYKFFMKATQLEQMKEDYSYIMKTKTVTQNTLEKHEATLQEIRNKYKEKEDRYKNLASLDEMQEKLNHLKHQMAWALVRSLIYIAVVGRKPCISIFDIFQFVTHFESTHCPLHCVREEHDLQRAIDKKQHELAAMEGSRQGGLRRFGEQMPAFIAAIEEADRQGQFRRKPVGPLGFCIRLRDADLGLAVESCLKSLMLAFCCDNYMDEKVLQALMIQSFPHGQRPQIIVTEFTDAPYNISHRAIDHPEYPSVLQALDIDNPVVTNCLIDMRGIETVLLIKNNKDARRVMQGGHPPRNCKEAFTREGDQVYNNRYYSSSQQRARYLSHDVEQEIRYVFSKQFSWLINNSHLTHRLCLAGILYRETLVELCLSLEERTYFVFKKKKNLPLMHFISGNFCFAFVQQASVVKASEICPERLDIRRTAKSLDNEISHLKHKISTQQDQHGDRDTIIRQYQEALENYNSVAQHVKGLKHFIHLLSKITNTRHNVYTEMRRYLSVRCKYYFDSMLSQRGYTGTMVFNHKKEALSVSVQPGEGDKATLSDMRSLSGGERSFSTVCFVLSLWAIAEAPFRCLDEFDVYMDMVNRRISMDMMLKIAASQRYRQFIFLTPQSMR
uniref:Structural maintenance of chromosomes protein 6 n=1 Tax=Pygocentrus nattereri TaxID=42514 RepID=A0AAR2IMD4_PYGNA